MKKIALGLLLCSPAFCDIFGISDAIYWAQQLAMMQQQIQGISNVYNTAMQYKQAFNNMAAFVHNPAQFLAQTAMLEQMALSTASATGMTSAKRAAQLQEVIRMQQVAMQEAQTIQTISHSNMASIGMLANNMVDSANALVATRSQMQNEQLSAYYQNRQYQPQSDIISRWRLK